MNENKYKYLLRKGESNEENHETTFINTTFCTSGGSGISGSLAHIRSAAGNGTVLEGMQINGAGTTGIQQWLQRIGVSGQSQ